MPAKPTSHPEWASGGSAAIVEPSSGKKSTGWEVNEQPPAQWFNWLLKNLYEWMQYLNAPVGTGSGAGIDATGGPTNGTGLIGRGAGTGNGVHGIGGPTSGDGVRGEGGTGNGKGVVGVGQGSGVGGDFTGGATGRGIVATATAFHAARFIGDLTSPDYAAVTIDPQDADPTTGGVGDLYINSDTDQLVGYNGADWMRYLAEGSAFGNGDLQDIANTTTPTAFTKTYVIPANKLREGSALRVKAFGDTAQAAGGNVTIELRVGGTTLVQIGPVALTNGATWRTELDMVITALGASGAFSGQTVGAYYNGSTQVAYSEGAGSGNAIDTTGTVTIDVRVTMTVASASNVVSLDGLIVDVS